jgi:hypothetical protein
MLLEHKNVEFLLINLKQRHFMAQKPWHKWHKITNVVTDVFVRTCTYVKVYNIMRNLI